MTPFQIAILIGGFIAALYAFALGYFVLEALRETSRSLYKLSEEAIALGKKEPPNIVVASAPPTITVMPSPVPVQVMAAPAAVTVEAALPNIDVHVAAANPTITVAPQHPIDVHVEAAQPLVTILPASPPSPLPVILRMEGAELKKAVVESAHEGMNEAATLLASFAEEVVRVVELRDERTFASSRERVPGKAKARIALRMLQERLKAVSPALPEAMTTEEQLEYVIDAAHARVYGARQLRERLRTEYAKQAVAYARSVGGLEEEQRTHAYEAFKKLDLGDNKKQDYTDAEVRIAVDAAFKE